MQWARCSVLHLPVVGYSDQCCNNRHFFKDVELRYQDIGQGPCTCKIIKDIYNNIDTRPVIFVCCRWVVANKLRGGGQFLLSPPPPSVVLEEASEQKVDMSAHISMVVRSRGGCDGAQQAPSHSVTRHTPSCAGPGETLAAT